MMPWMSWWNWLRRPPRRPYQFFVVIEARQRLWSFTGATPITFVTPANGRQKKGQRAMCVAPGVSRRRKSDGVGR